MKDALTVSIRKPSDRRIDTTNRIDVGKKIGDFGSDRDHSQHSYKIDDRESLKGFISSKQGDTRLK